MPTCPKCGSTHDTWGGVAVHIWKKADDDHDMAESKDDATVWLAENGHIKADTSPDMADVDLEPDGVAADGGATAVEFPQNPDADDTDDAQDDAPEQTGPECPECGPAAEVADAQAVARNQVAQLNGEHLKLLRESDYVCVQCGGVWDDE